MVPFIAAPHIQLPPGVETSLFTGQVSDPALGRLPFQAVPAPIHAQGSENNRQNAQDRQPPPASPAPDTASRGGFAFPPDQGNTIFLSFSTPFIAQLLGQFGGGDAMTPGLLGRESAGTSIFVDFERLAQFGNTKYMPSNAFRPREPAPQIAPPPTPAMEAMAAQLQESLRQMAPERAGVTMGETVAASGMAVASGAEMLPRDAVPVRAAQERPAGRDVPAGNGAGSGTAAETAVRGGNLVETGMVALQNRNGTDAYRALQAQVQLYFQLPRPEVSFVL